MTLFDRLRAHSLSGSLPMHMPGHKRNTDAFPWLEGLAGMDITEIDGFDDLNAPAGLFRDLERRASSLWGSSDVVCLVNGSTVGVLASVLSALGPGGELLMSRHSHKSVYNAAELAGASTRYLTPSLDPDTGLPLSVTPEDVASALDAHPDTGLVCLTSPTYEGVISDIAAISEICHSRGVPLFVDEAHGAHLGLPGFPQSAVRLGADLVVQSLHKTLPSLTQTALLHINSGLVDPEKVRRYVAMLQTSSPSYLLSASIDGCVDYLAREGHAASARWLAALSDFAAGAEALRNIRLWSPARGVFARDPSKLLLMSSPGLGAALRGKHNIEPEYSNGPLTLCMTGMGDSDRTLSRLLDALLDLDRSFSPPSPPPAAPRTLPRQVMSVREALSLPGKLLPASGALGRVSGEYAWLYPPGIPLIVPGEALDLPALSALSTETGLHFTHKHGPNVIFCVDLPQNI